MGRLALSVKNLLTRSLGQLRDDCEEYDWIYLHGNDGYSPGLLVFFSQVVSQDDIENECYVEAQYIGLELLCEGHATGIIFLLAEG